MEALPSAIAAIYPLSCMSVLSERTPKGFLPFLSGYSQAN